jgi:hypothetical protein
MKISKQRFRLKALKALVLIGVVGGVVVGCNEASSPDCRHCASR